MTMLQGSLGFNGVITVKVGGSLITWITFKEWGFAGVITCFKVGWGLMTALRWVGLCHHNCFKVGGEFNGVKVL